MEKKKLPEIGSDEIQEEKKRIPSIYKIFLITALAVLFTGTALSYLLPKSNEYPLPINRNIHDIDFIKLTEDLKDITKPDDGKLYPINRAFNLTIDKEGNLEGLSLDFIVLNNGRQVHYQTKVIKEEYLKLIIYKAFDIQLDKESLSDISDVAVTIGLMERLPWGHLKSKIDEENYSVLGISNSMTGDGEGKIRVEVGDNQARAFEVGQDGSITEFVEPTAVPESSYYVLCFAPLTEEDDGDFNGKLKLQYFFEVN